MQEFFDSRRLRDEQIGARKERDSIVRWLRVAYQLNNSAVGFADAIHNREHERPFDAPKAIVDGEECTTLEQYDAAHARTAADAQDRYDLFQPADFGRKAIDAVFEALDKAAQLGRRRPHARRPAAAECLRQGDGQAPARLL